MPNYNLYANEALNYLTDNDIELDFDAQLDSYIEQATDYGQCTCCRQFQVDKPLYDIGDSCDGDINVGLFCQSCINGMADAFEREIFFMLNEAEHAHASAVLSYQQAIGF